MIPALSAISQVKPEMDPERLHKGTPAGDALLESGSKRSPRSPRHTAPPKQFPLQFGGGDGAAGTAGGFSQLILARMDESSQKPFRNWTLALRSAN